MKGTVVELMTHPSARAYVYAGDWVSDCPRDGCGNVEHLYDLSNPRNPNSPRTVRKSSFFCSYCRNMAEIDWPENMQEIMDVLLLRPVPHNRNWYPKDHPTAVKFRVEHGQTIQELIDENAEHGIF